MGCERIVGFDYIRALAVMLVLLCHSGQSIGWERCGISGGVGNCMFFLLSGFCLGGRWREKGCPVLGLDFLKRRFFRLYLPFAIFLVLYVLYNGFSGHIIPITMNFLTLSWFFKLPGGGHLWFVSGMVICYAVLVAISIKGQTMRPCAALPIIEILLVCAAMQMGLALIGVKQAYFLSMLAGAMIAFLYGDCMVAFIGKWSLYFKVIGTMTFIFLLGTLSINYDMINVNDMPVVYYWLCMAIAMLLIAVVIAIGFQKLAQPFAFISVVSYETYLAHDPFRFVPHPPFSLDNKFIFLFYFIIVTILQGWVLHLLVSIVYRYIGWAKDWMCSKFPKLAK